MEGTKALQEMEGSVEGTKASQEVEGGGAGGLGNRILMACYSNIHQLALGFVWHLHIGSIKIFKTKTTTAAAETRTTTN